MHVRQVLGQTVKSFWVYAITVQGSFRISLQERVSSVFQKSTGCAPNASTAVQETRTNQKPSSLLDMLCSDPGCRITAWLFPKKGAKERFLQGSHSLCKPAKCLKIPLEQALFQNMLGLSAAMHLQAMALKLKTLSLERSST